MKARKVSGIRWRYVLAMVVLLLGVALLARWQTPSTDASPSLGKGLNAPADAAPVSQSHPKPDYSQSKVIGNVQVIPEVKHDVSPPLRDIPPSAPQPRQEGPENPMAGINKSTSFVVDPLVQRSFVRNDMPTPTVDFEGIDQPQSQCSCTPPDTEGDVGPNNYVQWVNSSFEIWDKSGNVVQGPRAGNTLWSGFGGACQTSNSGDPIVLYDPMADRWMFSQFTTSAPYYQCVAVSTTGDPTGSYNRYAFLVSPTLLNDYPKFGVWPDGYYMTSNRFLGNGYDSPAIIAFDRVRMLAGQSATMQLVNPGNFFFAILPADMDGSLPPPNGEPETIVGTAGTQNTVHFWRYHVDWNNPANTTLTGPINIVTEPFEPNLCGGDRNCVPQLGTTVKLDSLEQHTMYRLAYRNFGDHESLLTNQTVNVGTPASPQAGIRWWEFRDPATDPYIYQSGTYAPDSNWRWMGSIAMDHVGDVALGYSVSSSTMYPSIRYSGRLVDDPLGTLPQGEASIIEGTGAQTSGGHRWGDYSMMAVDPSDDCTFWYTDEYYATTSSGTWHTRVGAFKFPSCSANPPSPTGTPPTATPTFTPRPTETATPTACTSYSYATATATIVAGTDDTGNHCDDCTTYITLPFSVNFYGSAFDHAFVSSNGNVQFQSSDNAFGNACFVPSPPVPIFSYAAAVYWDDLVTNCAGCGVFTSVSGSAPSRILNVEWRVQVLDNSQPSNFEARFHEDSSNVEYIYGALGETGDTQTTGVMRDQNTFTQFSCDTTGSLSQGLEILWTAPACPTPIPTDTATSVPTETQTGVPTGTQTGVATETSTRVPSSTPQPGSPTVTSTPCTISFTDVHPTDYFYNDVKCVYCLGAVSGYSDGTFRPFANTTRGQMTKIIVLALRIPLYTPTAGATFNDVPRGSTFFDYVETAAHNQIVSGYSDGSFRPNALVTRGQLSKIDAVAANKMMGWDLLNPTTPTFSDVPRTNPFYTYIETVSCHGVVSGYSDGTFKWGNNAIRAQIAKIVCVTSQDPPAQCLSGTPQVTVTPQQ